MNNCELPTSVSFPGSPAISSAGVVYVVDSSYSLYALDFSVGGPPLWKASCSGCDFRASVSAPAVHNLLQLVLYSAGPAGVIAVNSSGSRVWTFVPSPVGTVSCDTVPAINQLGTQVFFGCDDAKLYCLNATLGALLWSYLAGGVIASSAAISRDGALVFFSSAANNFVALNTQTGRQAWLPVALSPSPVTTAPVVGADAIIVALGDGTVFAANNTAVGSVNRSMSLGDTVTATPTLGNGTVFIATDGGIVVGLCVATGAIRWSVTLNDTISAPSVLVPSGVLLVPSASEPLLYAIRGTIPKPSAVATATTTVTATASSTASGSATASATASASATTTAINSTTQSCTATVSPNATSGSGNSNNGNGVSIDAPTAIILSALLPVIAIVMLFGVALSRGTLRFGDRSGQQQQKNVGANSGGVVSVGDWSGRAA